MAASLPVPQLGYFSLKSSSVHKLKIKFLVATSRNAFIRWFEVC